MNLRLTAGKVLGAAVVLAVVLGEMIAMAGGDSKKTGNAGTPAKTAAKPPQGTTKRPGTTTTSSQTRTTKTTQSTTTTHPPPSPPPPAPPPKSPGPVTYKPKSTDQVTTLSNGRIQYRDPKSSRTVTTDATGKVHRIEAPTGISGSTKIMIDRGSHGGRQIVTTRPGGVRVVGYGTHRGFVERPMRTGYVSRTYVAGGQTGARVYHVQQYRGVTYYRYVRGVYYSRAYYAWGSRPWVRPMPYFWGGPMVAPWLGFYRGYFTPYAVYPSANLWLTDYVLSASLSTAYQDQQDANGDQPPGSAPQSGAPITLMTKQFIAGEVSQQLAAEQAAALQPIPEPPDPGKEQLPPVFSQKFVVVSSSLEVTAAGQGCTLTPGDILERRGNVVTPDGGVAMEVVTSKAGDCSAESAPVVDLAALQEMRNQLQEQIDAGLEKLAQNQAPGLPAAPPADPRKTPEGIADVAENAVEELEAQQKAADLVEVQVGQGGGN